jgi:hypothetical protein
MVVVVLIVGAVVVLIVDVVDIVVVLSVEVVSVVVADTVVVLILRSVDVVVILVVDVIVVDVVEGAQFSGGTGLTCSSPRLQAARTLRTPEDVLQRAILVAAVWRPVHSSRSANRPDGDTQTNAASTLWAERTALRSTALTARARIRRALTAQRRALSRPRTSNMGRSVCDSGDLLARDAACAEHDDAARRVPAAGSCGGDHRSGKAARMRAAAIRLPGAHPQRVTGPTHRLRTDAGRRAGDRGQMPCAAASRSIGCSTATGSPRRIAPARIWRMHLESGRP